MFEVKASCFKIRKFAIQDYQEQGKNLDVIFVCEDGEQRCSRLTLNLMSDFYTAQLEGRDRLNNEPVFTYKQYPKQVIKTFLDIMHCIDSKLDLVELLMLIKFLRYEGKSDASDFEKALLKSLCDQLKRGRMSIRTKLLICFLCNSFDNFEVRQLEKSFFRRNTQEDLLLALANMDWESTNKAYMQLLRNWQAEINPHGTDFDVLQIESQIYVMIRIMKMTNLLEPSTQEPDAFLDEPYFGSPAFAAPFGYRG